MDNKLPANPWEKPIEEPKNESVEVVKKTSSVEETSVKPEFLTTEKDEKEKLEASKLDKKQLLKKKVTKIILILAPFVLVLLVLSLVAMVMGWDKGILKASVTGNIYDAKNLPIKSATVTIGDQKATTDDNGEYRINNLDYGTNKVSIKAEDYEDLTSSVVLSRGENSGRNFTMQFITYSYIQGKLIFDSASIDPANFTLKVGNTELSVDTNGEFKSGKLDLGKTTITLTSPIYKDFSQDLTLVAGKNIAPDITLTPAKDVKITTQDFLSGVKLSSVDLSFQSQSYKSDANGEYTLKDYTNTGNLAITASKSGYLAKVSTLANVTDSLILELVPTGRIYYTSNRDGIDNIYSSNYDGSDEKKLTDGKGSISGVEKSTNGDLYFYSDRDHVTGSSASSQLYSVSINGGSIKRIGDLKTVSSVYPSMAFEQVFPSANKLVNVSYTYTDSVPPFSANPTNRMRLTIKNITGNSNETVLFDQLQRASDISLVGDPEYIIVSDDGKKVTYTYKQCDDTGCAYRMVIQNTDGTSLKEVVLKKSSDGYITDVKGFTLNSKYLVYSVYDNTDKAESIFSYNIASGKLNKFSGTNLLSYQGQVGGDEGFAYYIATRDSKADVYRLNLDSGTIDKLTNSGNVQNFFVLNSSVLLTEITNGTDSKLYIQGIGNLSAKIVPVSTSFSMWSSSYYYGD